jgi:hypothetical protein
MYQLFRNIHLILGLFSSVFLLAYGLSAAQMAYPIYRPRMHETKSELTIPAEVELAPRPFAKWLMDHHDMRGDLQSVETSSTSITVSILRPATQHRATVDLSSRRAEIVTGRSNVIGMLNRLHHTGGLWHEYWPINAWGWFVAVVSIFLLIIPATGVYMWFKRHRERKLGTILFAAGLLWGLTLLVLVRWQ